MNNSILDVLLNTAVSSFDILSTGTFKRVKLINSLNGYFNSSYISGESHRLLKVKIAIGELRNKHSQSTNILVSGFKIIVQNEERLKREEIVSLGINIVNNTGFVRLLTTLGFDTLYVESKTMFKGYDGIELNKFVYSPKLLK